MYFTDLDHLSQAVSHPPAISSAPDYVVSVTSLTLLRDLSAEKKEKENSIFTLNIPTLQLLIILKFEQVHCTPSECVANSANHD